MNRHLSLLERRDVAPPAETQFPSDEALASMANPEGDAVLATIEERIGYVPPTVKEDRAKQMQKVEEIRTAKKKASLPLARELRAIGVKPFTSESVRLYQRAMVRNCLQLFDGEVSDSMFPLGMIGGFVINCLLFWVLGRVITHTCSLEFSLGYLGWIPPALIPLGVITSDLQPPEWMKSCIIFVACGSFLVPVILFGPSDREWKASPLRDYEKDIPREVLGTVAEIAHRCPQAVFSVEEITKKQDPFLIVSLGAERYYIEVWEEPRFDGRRAV